MEASTGASRPCPAPAVSQNNVGPAFVAPITSLPRLQGLLMGTSNAALCHPPAEKKGLPQRMQEQAPSLFPRFLLCALSSSLPLNLSFMHTHPPVHVQSHTESLSPPFLSPSPINTLTRRCAQPFFPYQEKLRTQQPGTPPHMEALMDAYDRASKSEGSLSSTCCLLSCKLPSPTVRRHTISPPALRSAAESWW